MFCVWNQHDFGPLDPHKTFRLAIPAVTATTLGFQVVLSSFFFSMLGLDRKTTTQLDSPIAHDSTEMNQATAVNGESVSDCLRGDFGKHRERAGDPVQDQTRTTTDGRRSDAA